MFGLGPLEMLIVGVIAVLLFGNRLPEVGRSLGKGLIEFKKGLLTTSKTMSIFPTPAAIRFRAGWPTRPPIEELDEAETAPKFVPPTHEPTATTENHSAGTPS